MTSGGGRGSRGPFAMPGARALARMRRIGAAARRLGMAMHHVRRGLSREDGQATVETIVSFMVSISLVFWMFELCLFAYTCSVLNDAAQEGVRYAIMHGTDSAICSGPDGACTDNSPYANVQAVATSVASASLHNMTAMTVTVTYANSTAAPGNPVAVKVVYTYVPYLNLPGLDDKVTFSSKGQIVY